jgi:DNA-binding NtrC family response regulator
MPPLRDRDRDPVLLAQHFIATFAKEFRRPVRGMTTDAECRLVAHGWPGNVRELRNVIERAVLLSDREMLEPDDFDFRRASSSPAPDKGKRLPIELPADGINLEEVERSLVQQALDRAQGNKTRAGALLGLHRDQIRYRIEKFGFPDER